MSQCKCCYSDPKNGKLFTRYSHTRHTCVAPQASGASFWSAYVILTDIDCTSLVEMIWPLFVMQHFGGKKLHQCTLLFLHSQLIIMHIANFYRLLKWWPHCCWMDLQRMIVDSLRLSAWFICSQADSSTCNNRTVNKYVSSGFWGQFAWETEEGIWQNITLTEDHHFGLWLLFDEKYVQFGIKA